MPLAAGERCVSEPLLSPLLPTDLRERIQQRRADEPAPAAWGRCQHGAAKPADGGCPLTALSGIAPGSCFFLHHSHMGETV